MSDERLDDPFASPAPSVPQSPQWQGSPVPRPPAYTEPPTYTPQPIAADEARVPPPPGAYAQVPPPPGNTQQPPPVQYPAPNAVAYPPPPPAGYGYAPTYAPSAAPKNWMGITALILSVITPIFVITAIPGVIFGHLGLAACKRGEANNRGLALAGVIVGWIMIGLMALSVVILVLIEGLYSGVAY